MPKLRPEPPIVGVEKELMDALKRLEDGRPRDPDLLKKARLKKLRINATTVAKEAGRARTLIGHDGCAYPRVRAAIKLHENPIGPTTSFEDVNRSLREQNADLRKTVLIATSRLAAMIRRMDAVDKAAAEEVKKAKRGSANKSPASNANQVAGARLVRKSLGKVLSFPGFSGSEEEN
jgi:hypothetical protein